VTPAPAAPEGSARPAGLVSRVLAVAVDAALLGAAFASVHFGLLALREVLLWHGPVLQAMGRAIQALADALLVPAYHVAGWSLTGQTAGKGLLGLRVVEASTGRRPRPARALLRFAAYTVSIAPLFAGVAAIAFDPARRAWHDRIAGTRVVYDRARLAGTVRVRMNALAGTSDGEAHAPGAGPSGGAASATRRW
jgi:uncharacterized RDD family membrane protein YckC